MPQVNKHAQAAAFGTIGLLVLVHLFSRDIDLYRLTAYACLFIFETWALTHKGDGDTYSEGFWSIACFPLIPWLSCFFFMQYTQVEKVITDSHEIGALLALQAHLFWQSWNVYRSFLGFPDGRN